ncbi:lysophospholipid acyltransferase family protein [Cytophagaceae bacterium YF14B1]|uniref:Lysophospholipid acyltransferase family protein n=1 Tax=Xanthocytophaga flava TaxID=3048013 RepID=A0AAE3U931_9BACT|nr:lysophospholipid acyltransferase family protein [Xanthocytophaga flavus]MDJ1483272.1 lysophospholipid acyltransferase family protein [Xanthocytophaga flavus]
MYFLLKLIARLALRVFFRKIHVQGLTEIPVNGPLLVAANHPNTFMDPILIAVYLKQDIYFLANGSIFKNPVVAWFLKKLHMIPIYRKKDVGAGEKVNNSATFSKCFEFLRKKGTLLIFPEGTSEHERRLRPLKTGTARIALGAEASANFELGVKILPVGLTYTDPKHFQSEVFVHFATPIDVQSYKEHYQQDEFATVDALTEDLRQRLEHHTITTSNEEHDLLVHNIEKLYKNRLIDELEISDDPSKENFLITKGIAEAVTYYETNQPQRFLAIRQKIQEYVNLLNKLSLDEETITRENQLVHRLTRGIFLVLGFPIYLYGLIFNYLPYILPSKIAGWISKDVTYRAPLMMITGIITFTGFYIAEIYYFYQRIPLLWPTILFALSLPVSGFICWYYWLLAEDSYESWSFRRLSQKRKTQITHLLTERKEIFVLLEEAKQEYLGTIKAES